MIRLLAAAILLLPFAARAQDISVAHTGAPAVTLDAAHTGAPAVTLDAAHLAAFPATDVTLTSGNPPAPHVFHGPLLWTLLTATGVVDPARHSDAVRQTLYITGADHYVAIIAAGELSPEFEDKPAILALTLDGKPLARPRAVIPGDHRGGRGVHDVVRLMLDELPKPTP